MAILRRNAQRGFSDLGLGGLGGRFSAIALWAQRDSGLPSYSVQYDEFFGLVGQTTDSQGQTIDVSAGVTVAASVTTSQGQTIEASGYPAGDGPINTLQGQTIAASGSITAASSVTTSQGQTIDSSGVVKADASTTTAQGSQTIDAAGVVKSNATGTTSQGQTIDASATIGGGVLVGAVDTSQGQTIDAPTWSIFTSFSLRTEQGVRNNYSLWRLAPRIRRISIISDLAQKDTGSALPGVARELFFHLDGALLGQTIDAVGDTPGFVRTSQGAQTIDAQGAVTGATTAQGSQTITAAGLVYSAAQVNTKQASQSASVNVYWDIDATVATKQGQTLDLRVPAVGATAQGQTIDAVGSVPIAAAVTTSQGSQTNDGTLSGEFEQTVNLSGFSASAFGTASLHSNKLQLQGFDTAAFGTLHIGNNKIKLSGFQTSAFGVPKLQNYTSYIKLAGKDFSSIGRPVIKDTATHPRGFDSAKFGTAFVSNYERDIFLSGFDAQHFGATDIQNFNREFPLSGFDSKSFGTAKIFSNKIPLSVGDTSRFGTAFISNYTRYVQPDGIDAEVNVGGQPAVGDATIFNFLTYASLQGFDSSAVPSPLQIAFRIRHLPLRGFDNFRYGTERIFNWLTYVHLNGFDHSVVWDDFGPINPATGHGARIFNASDASALQGQDSARVGTPTLVQMPGSIQNTPC